MSADEFFVLALVIGSVIAVVGMAVQSRRAKSSAPATAAQEVSSGAEPAPTAPRQTTPDRRKR
jgi:hypothetical protein